MKLLSLFIFPFLFIFSFFWISLWEDTGPTKRWSENSKPIKVLDEVRNKDWVQDTQLDNVQWRDVESTLESVRREVGYYINWAVFIWLSVSVILIIYNWLLLITTSMNESVLWKVKTRLLYLWIWVLVLTWFYIIIQVVMSLLANIT